MLARKWGEQRADVAVFDGQHNQTLRITDEQKGLLGQEGWKEGCIVKSTATHLTAHWWTTRPGLSQKTILYTCDNWDTDYNSYNWKPEFMTIFVTWQLRVTVDSIRNSCDVSYFGPIRDQMFPILAPGQDVIIHRRIVWIFLQGSHSENRIHYLQ